MTIKRKRSDASLSPSSTSSIYSRNESPSPSPSRFHQFNFNVKAPCVTPIEYLGHAGSCFVNSSGRTRKRHRDDRPEEAVIHANTIQRLFDAQRQLSEAPPSAQPTQPNITDAVMLDQPTSSSTSAMSVQQQQPRSQSSLHRFFKIPSAPKSNMMPAVGETIFEPTRANCEDCDRSLHMSEGEWRGGESMDLGMDPWTACKSVCRGCGKTVCDLCAIVEIGGDRDCIHCRMRLQ